MEEKPGDNGRGKGRIWDNGREKRDSKIIEALSMGTRRFKNHLASSISVGYPNCD